MVKYLWRTQSSSVSEICPHPWVDWQCAQSIPLDQPHTDWATSANRGTTLKRISEGPSHYGSEANLPTWPQRIPLASFPLALPFVNSYYWQARPVFPFQHTSMLYWVYPPPRPVL